MRRQARGWGLRNKWWNFLHGPCRATDARFGAVLVLLVDQLGLDK